MENVFSRKKMHFPRFQQNRPAGLLQFDFQKPLELTGAAGVSKRFCGNFSAGE